MIKYEYDPKDVVSQRIGKHVHGQWRSLTEMIAIGIMLFVLWVLSRIVLGRMNEYFSQLDAGLPIIVAVLLWGGITMGLLGAYLVILFLSRYRDLRKDQDNEMSSYRAGPFRVEIGPDGVSRASNGRSEQIRWSSIGGVKSTPLGLGLPLDDRDFIPLDQRLLPSGMTVDQAVETIEGWQKAGA